MIDIHTHILPFVDDGSKDMETSIDLIKFEISQGVTDIFVTPHYISYRNYLSPVKENAILFNELVLETKKQCLDINLYLGTEIYYDALTMKHLKDQVVKPLGETNYVLIEFSLYQENEDIAEAINNLVAKGYVPVIAHPERYPYIKKIDDYECMRRMGAKIQINASAVLGKYGKKIKKLVLNLIKNDLVDFVASDIHAFRIVGLKKAYAIVENSFSKEKAESIFNNQTLLN